MNNVRQLKPYGWLHTQGQQYLLLSPHPSPYPYPAQKIDGHWTAGVYAFSVAKQFNVEGTTWWEAITVISNAFVMELDGRIPPISISQADVADDQPEELSQEPDFDDYPWEDNENPFLEDK